MGPSEFPCRLPHYSVRLPFFVRFVYFVGRYMEMSLQEDAKTRSGGAGSDWVPDPKLDFQSETLPFQFFAPCRTLPYSKSLFPFFREWVQKTRRRKDWKKAAELPNMEEPGAPGVNVNCLPGRLPVRSIRVWSRATPELIAKQRSPEAFWLNIIQLTEPFLTEASSSLQERYLP